MKPRQPFFGVLLTYIRQYFSDDGRNRAPFFLTKTLVGLSLVGSC